MVRTVMVIEGEIGDTRSIRDFGAGEKRKGSKSSSSSGKKQRAFVSQGSSGQGHGYQGQGRVGASSQTGQTTCFHCHQPGHMRRDYPRR